VGVQKTHISGRPGVVLKALWLDLCAKFGGEKIVIEHLGKRLKEAGRRRAALSMLAAKPVKVSYTAGNLNKALEAPALTFSTLIRAAQGLGMSKMIIQVTFEKASSGNDPNRRVSAYTVTQEVDLSAIDTDRESDQEDK
jgi:hypothetical protein